MSKINFEKIRLLLLIVLVFPILSIEVACNDPQGKTITIDFLMSPEFADGSVSITKSAGKVVFIKISNYRGASLPPEITNLNALVEINISNSDIEQFSFIEKLPDLHSIVLNDTKLKHLPDLSNNLSLEHLYISGSNLSGIIDFSKLSKSLKSLTIDRSNIIGVNNIDSLSELSRLSLSNNKLNGLESSICKLEKLYDLNISQNPDLLVDSTILSCLSDVDFFDFETTSKMK